MRVHPAPATVLEAIMDHVTPLAERCQLMKRAVALAMLWQLQRRGKDVAADMNSVIDLSLATVGAGNLSRRA